MITPTPPSATDALQKARELAELRKKAAEESNAIGRHGKAAMEWKRESYVHFPSIHAELEKVTQHREELLAMVKSIGKGALVHSEANKVLTTERDVALKGYRGMREVIGEIDHSHRCDIRTDGTGCNCHMIRVKAVLTSFPEIK